MDYQRYLASREWAVRREAVRQRAGGWCECCRKARMQQVHHKTYVNKGNEPLEDLLGVCRPCHEYLSAKTTVDPITDGVRVYLAGPMTGTRWREDLLASPRAICISRTAEEFHKDNLGDRDTLWRDEPVDFPVAHRGLRGGFDFAGPHIECSSAHSIKNSDVVFCWSPKDVDYSRYGVVWELGYAAALKKPIVVFEQCGTDDKEKGLGGTITVNLWGCAETPSAAWDMFANAFKEGWDKNLAVANWRGRFIKMMLLAFGRQSTE